MEKDFNNIDEKLLLEDERIANYLKGKMTADEEQAFMRELETNAELKEKAIAMARMVKAMKEVGMANDEEVVKELLAADSDEIEAVSKETVSESSDAETVKTSSTLKWRWKKPVLWLSSAASVAMLIWVGMNMFVSRDFEPPADQDNKGNIYNRGGSSAAEIDSLLSELYYNIDNEKDLGKTTQELSYYWNQATQESYNDYTNFAPEIGWNLANGYLKINDREHAKAVLMKLIKIAPAGTAIGDKARELLKNIKEL